MIIGITGTFGAGKGTVVSYLEDSHNVNHYSARTLLTEILTERGIPVERDAMTQLANELAAEHGPSYIAEELFRRAEAPAIIESIRRPSEVEYLKKHGGVLLAVDADQRLRYDRVIERGSETDQVSFEKFKEQEAFEMEHTSPTDQNIRSCIEMADYVLNNNGSFEDLHAQIDVVLQQLQS